MLKKIVVLGLSLSVISCATQQPKLTPEKEQSIKQNGEDAAMKLLKTLKTELMQAMQTGGPQQAVEVCSEKAMALTNQIENQTGYKLKRTTFKYRNPSNKPDKYEEEALRYFEEAINREGKMPAYYVQTVKENGVLTYRYYKPLKVEGLCLTCHGDKNLMDKNLVSKLEKLYPEDKATGYKEGDFRGVVRVSIPAEKIK